MAENSLPRSIAELIDLGTHCKSGLTAYGAALNILQYTPLTLGAKLGALEEKQLAFNTARSAYAVAFTPLHTVQAQMRRACLTARKLLSISFGDDWTAEWAGAGWVNTSTEVPQDVPGLIALCNNLASFLANHADYVVDTAKVTFTQDLFNNMVNNVAGWQGNLSTLKTQKDIAADSRTVEEKGLRDELSGLIFLLGKLLSPNDARWDAFGLNRPGASTTPAQGELPTLSKVSGGAVLAAASAVPLATYYRWFSQLVGVDLEFRFMGTTQDPMIELPGQPATGTLNVKFQAANEAGPGKASPAGSLLLG